MAIMNKLKQFINHILGKESPKLLAASNFEFYDESDNSIDLSEIESYIKLNKYQKKLSVSLTRITPKSRKNLMNKIDTGTKGLLNKTHDNTPLVEGRLSGKDFISVRRKNVPLNKVGQTILTENGYIDISTRKKSKENTYANLYYKEYNKGETYEDTFEIDMKNDRYSRIIKGQDIAFSQAAIYASEEDMELIESLAQPQEEQRAIDEYLKLTHLTYVSTDEQYNIWNALKMSPYLVQTEAVKYNKNGNLALRKSVSVVYKSKKECIVGYRPVIILIEEQDSNIYKKHLYRLLDDGQYADNSSFRQNFEGKYTINRVSLAYIQSKIKEISLNLSSETKSIIRNGYDIPEHYRRIYETGLMQIHILGLDRIQEHE